MSKKKSSINIPISVDQKGLVKLIQQLSTVDKTTKGLSGNLNSVIKGAELSINNVNNLSKKINSFTTGISKGLRESVKELDKLGKEAEAQKKRLAALGEASQKAKDPAEKKRIQNEMDDASKQLRSLEFNTNKVIESMSKYNKEIVKGVQLQKKYKDTLSSAAKSGLGSKDLEGIGGSIREAIGGGAKGIFKLLGNEAIAGYAKNREKAAIKTGGVEGDIIGASAGKDVQAAMASLSIAAAAIGEIIELLKKASDHMTALNTAMLNGVGFGNDLGSSAASYRTSIREMSQSAIDAAGDMFTFGINSKAALESVNAYAINASGSIAKTADQMEILGDGSQAAGLARFAIGAKTYGQALGMSANEASSMMGNMVSEIGMSHENVLQIMKDVTSQAAASGMPMQKFMDVFKNAVPELDLYTNRIEEVTGVIKMMGKTMDPRQMRSFMDAFGKGFDQMDFKQRLKMFFVVGPKQMNDIMKKDFARSTKSISSQLGNLGGEFADIMAGKKGDITEATAKLAARAKAQGIGGSTISNMQDLARSESLRRKGDPLNQASAMRGMGMIGRMDALEKYAGKFTGGDINGLGEAVAKQLGVSEQEYKAILKLKDSMSVYSAEVDATGRTSSKSINDALKKQLSTDGKPLSDEELEKTMRKMSKDERADNIKLAASTAAQDEMEANSAEALAKENVKATTSINDAMTNVVEYYLEKVFSVLTEVNETILDILMSIPGNSDNREAANAIGSMKQTKSASITDAGEREAYNRNMDKLQRMTGGSASSSDLMSSFRGNFGAVSEVMNPNKDPRNGAVLSDKELLEKKAALAKILEKAYQGSDSHDEVMSSLWSNDQGGLEEAMKADKGALAKYIADTMPTDGTAGVARVASSSARFKDSDEDSRFKAAMNAANPGDVSSLKGGGSPSTDPSKAIIEQAAATSNIEDHSKKTVAATVRTADVMEGGIKFDQSFLNGKYKNTLHDSFLEALRTALYEFLILQQKAAHSSEFSDFLAGGMSAGADPSMFLGTSMDGGETSIGKMIKTVTEGNNHAKGGPIDFNQVSQLHGGEYVVPKSGALVKSGDSSSKKIVNVYATINATTDASPQQIAEAVHEMHRKQ